MADSRARAGKEQEEPGTFDCARKFKEYWEHVKWTQEADIVDLSLLK